MNRSSILRLLAIPGIGVVLCTFIPAFVLAQEPTRDALAPPPPPPDTLAPPPPARAVPTSETQSRPNWALYFPGKEPPDGTRVLLDPASGKEAIDVGSSYRVARCAYSAKSPDGKLVAAVYLEQDLVEQCHVIVLWTVAADRHPRSAAILPMPMRGYTSFEDSYSYVTFSSNGRLLAANNPVDETIVWDTATGKQIFRPNVRGLVVAFGPGDKYVVLVTRDGLVEHCDLTTGECVAPAGKTGRNEFMFVASACLWSDGRTVILSDQHTGQLKDMITGATFRWTATGTSRLPPTEALHTTWRRKGDAIVDTATGREVARLAANELPMDECDTLLSAVQGKYDVPFQSHRDDNRKPPMVSLKATLSSRKASYTLDLGGKTPEEFARQIDAEAHEGKLPPAPEVDLVLTLRNAGTGKIAFDREGISIYAFLSGDGAMNHPLEEYQSGYVRQELHEIVLAPGETYSLPLRSFDFGHCMCSYWLLPGQYTVHATCTVFVSPAPEDAKSVVARRDDVELDVPPLQLKVVAGRK